MLAAPGMEVDRRIVRSFAWYRFRLEEKSVPTGRRQSSVCDK